MSTISVAPSPNPKRCYSFTYRSLRVKEPSNAVPQFVEQHGVEGRAELQAQQVLHISADVEADPIVAAHQQRQQPVQKAADGSLVGGGRGERGSRHQRVGHVAGAHGDHGVLAFCRRAHGRAVGGRTGGAALLEANSSQSTQETSHVDPLLLRGWGTDTQVSPESFPNNKNCYFSKI